jgi:hypothetical protein
MTVSRHGCQQIGARATLRGVKSEDDSMAERLARNVRALREARGHHASASGEGRGRPARDVGAPRVGDGQPDAQRPASRVPSAASDDRRARRAAERVGEEVHRGRAARARQRAGQGALDRPRAAERSAVRAHRARGAGEVYGRSASRGGRESFWRASRARSPSFSAEKSGRSRRAKCSAFAAINGTATSTKAPSAPSGSASS